MNIRNLRSTANSGNIVMGLLIVVLVVALVIFGPLLFIWSLNTLFPVLAIDYTLKTWFAALVVHGAVGGAKYSSSKKS